MTEKGIRVAHLLVPLVEMVVEKHERDHREKVHYDHGQHHHF
jgi:hypothetical protein